MSKVSKVVRELRLKYGLDPDTGRPPGDNGESLIPTVERITQGSKPRLPPIDPLQLIVIALRDMAARTDREDLKPHYTAIADEIVEIRRKDRTP